MFDKNTSFQSSNKQSNQPQVPNQPASKEVDNDQKGHGVEDIFSLENNKTKTENITEEQKKMVGKVLSPNIEPENAFPSDNIVVDHNTGNDKSLSKSNNKILFIILILFVILCLLVTTAWYYVNYIQEKTENENIILDQNQNNNSNKNLSNINKNEIDKNENQNNNVNKNTNVASRDSDFDGLSDEEEMQLGTNIHMADTDSDGLLDKEEIKIYYTDPLKNDTDGDGYLDGDEIRKGYNPNGEGKLPFPPMMGIKK